MEKSQIIALIDLMSGLSPSETKKLMSLSNDDLERMYRLILLEKNDEMRN